MVECELCGAETDDPRELYGRVMCQECYGYFKENEGRRYGGCCFCR